MGAARMHGAGNASRRSLAGTNASSSSSRAPLALLVIYALLAVPYGHYSPGLARFSFAVSCIIELLIMNGWI